MPGALGLEAEDLARPRAARAFALLGRHELLDVVGEQDQPHAVVVLDRAERDSAATSAATRAFGARRVPKRSLADRSTSSITVISRSSMNTLTKVSFMRARDVPVDGADVVARLVLAHLAERQPLALEDRVVAARELLVGEPRRVDLDLAELP